MANVATNTVADNDKWKGFIKGSSLVWVQLMTQHIYFSKVWVPTPKIFFQYFNVQSKLWK